MILRVFGSSSRTSHLTQIQEHWRFVGSTWTIGSCDLFALLLRRSTWSWKGSKGKEETAIQSVGVGILGGYFLEVGSVLTYTQDLWGVLVISWFTLLLNMALLEHLLSVLFQSGTDELVRAEDDQATRYGPYPARAIFRGSTQWFQAVETLLELAETILVDVRGFRPENQGISAEISLLFRKHSIDKILFLADARTDREAFADIVRKCWHSLDPESPNAGNEDHPKVVHIFVLANLIRPLGLNEKELDSLCEVLWRRGNGPWLPWAAT